MVGRAVGWSGGLLVVGWVVRRVWVWAVGQAEVWSGGLVVGWVDGQVDG